MLSRREFVANASGGVLCFTAPLFLATAMPAPTPFVALPSNPALDLIVDRIRQSLEQWRIGPSGPRGGWWDELYKEWSGIDDLNKAVERKLAQFYAGLEQLKKEGSFPFPVLDPEGALGFAAQRELKLHLPLASDVCDKELFRAIASFYKSL